MHKRSRLPVIRVSDFLFSIFSNSNQLSIRIAPSPLLLASHFFAVAFYSIWVMFTHPSPVHSSNGDKPVYVVASIDQYPSLLIKSIRVVCYPFLVNPMMYLNLSIVLEGMCSLWALTMVRTSMVGTLRHGNS